MITRMNPMDKVRPFERFNKLMEDLWVDTPMFLTPWTPPVDIRETAKEFVFTFELPGVHEEDVEIEVRNDNVLWVRGKREMLGEVKREEYLRVERTYGMFERAFTLYGKVLPEKIVATFKDGLLTVVVPKVAMPSPKKVAIHRG